METTNIYICATLPELPVIQIGVQDVKFQGDAESIRIETLGLPRRILNALIESNIRTVGGVKRQLEKDHTDVCGLADKGVQILEKLLKDTFDIDIIYKHKPKFK